MPVLDWIGKQAVVNHHKEVPYRLLHCDSTLSVGDPDSGNLIVQGDNLEALKALLPYYKGQVDCIYIDPPYNTGNENWVYNDNVNSPEIREWFEKTVGKEGEDLSRHDKWLCMMYPRLKLLRELLAEDGSFWMTLDDNESHQGKLVLDEIFGNNNFIANVVWEKKYTVANDAKWLSDNHDHVMVYAKNKNNWKPNRISRSEHMNARYTNPDNHPKGPWKSTPLHAKSGNESGGIFTYTCKNGYKWSPPSGTFPRYNKERLREFEADHAIWFGKNGKSKPSRKTFLSDLKFDGPPARTLWLSTDVGHNHEARTELKELLPSNIFDTPKPLGLLQQILKIATDENALILDSFAGSGTTAHAALEANKLDGGNRRFIMVEIEEQIANRVTAKRMRRVIEGYNAKDDPKKPVQGLGGGFRYCTLGTPLFNEYGDINQAVTFPDLAAHIFFSETGLPLPKKVDGSTSLIGQHKDKSVYLLFSQADQGFAREAAGNVLTPDMLKNLPPAPLKGDHMRVVYAEGCTTSEERLRAANIVFKHIPYHIEGA